MKTNSKNHPVWNYILSCVDGSGYDKELNTDQEKLQFIAECFKSEYCYPENLRQYGSYQNTFTQWIMGLPSSFNVDFENSRIIEIAKKWQSIPMNATEREEDKIIANWFSFISAKTFQLFSKHKISLN